MVMKSEIMFLFILVVLNLIVYSNQTPRLRALVDPKVQLKTQISKMEAKCMIGMKGLKCNGVRVNPLSRNVMEDLPIVAGVGYSRIDHTIKPQIVKSPQAKKVTQTVTKFLNVMDSAERFFDYVYPGDGVPIYNGLYSHNSGAAEIFTNYFKGNMMVMDAQQQYVTHAVSVDKVEVTEDFQRILDILPSTLDRDLYNLVISSFGDSILYQVEYGGVVDLTVSVRSCFNDANMKNYLDLELQMAAGDAPNTLPSGYIRYHKVSQLDIVGGNPELSDIKQRVNTFSLNPVPVKFLSVPIWRAFPNGPKQENMKKVYQEYLDAKVKEILNIRSSLYSHIQSEQAQTLPFYVYHYARNGKIGQLGEKIELSGAGSGFATDFIKMFNQPQMKNYAFKPYVHRQEDGSFYFDFIKGTCNSISVTNCAFPDINTTFLRSASGKGQCVQVSLPTSGSEYYSTSSVWVCSGCQPFVSESNTLTCNCPYVN